MNRFRDSITRSLAALGCVLLALSAFADEGDGPAAPDDAVAEGVASTESGDRTEGLYRFDVIWENDGGILRPGGPDRHYTNGLLFSYAHQPDWARQVTDGLGLESTATAAGYHFGQQIFTPENLTLAMPDPADRPYAGYLFGGLFWQRENGDQLDHLQTDLGVVGPSSGADDVQDWVHDWFGGQDPQGWNTQIGDEFTYQLTYRHKWRIDLGDPGFFGDELRWQLIPQAGFGLGNVYRQIELGATLRVGQQLLDNFGPASIADRGSATGLSRRWAADRAGQTPRFRWSLFGKAGVRFVEHNIFLDGPDGEPGPSVDSEPVVGEFTGGVELSYRINDHWSIDASYANTLLTDEFEDQDDRAIFATLNLAVRATW